MRHRKGKKGPLCGGKGPTTIEDRDVTCHDCLNQLDSDDAALARFKVELAEAVKLVPDKLGPEALRAVWRSFVPKDVEVAEDPDWTGFELLPRSRVPILKVSLRSKEAEVPGMLLRIAICPAPIGSGVVIAPERGNPVNRTTGRLYGEEPDMDIHDLSIRVFEEGLTTDFRGNPYDPDVVPGDNLRAMLEWLGDAFSAKVVEEEIDNRYIKEEEDES